MPRHEKIPKDYPVQPLRPSQKAKERCTCGYCGLSWDDGKITSMTPTPSGRCPFESFHYPEHGSTTVDRIRDDLQRLSNELGAIDDATPAQEDLLDSATGFIESARETLRSYLRLEAR